MVKWNKLSPSSRIRLYDEGSDRVPKGYSPEADREICKEVHKQQRNPFLIAVAAEQQALETKKKRLLSEISELSASETVDLIRGLEKSEDPNAEWVLRVLSKL